MRECALTQELSASYGREMHHMMGEPAAGDSDLRSSTSFIRLLHPFLLEDALQGRILTVGAA